MLRWPGDPSLRVGVQYVYGYVYGYGHGYVCGCVYECRGSSICACVGIGMNVYAYNFTNSNVYMSVCMRVFLYASYISAYLLHVNHIC